MAFNTIKLNSLYKNLEYLGCCLGHKSKMAKFYHQVMHGSLQTFRIFGF
jgi:hypothetical protein